jgi:hypothetical protein
MPSTSSSFMEEVQKMIRVVDNRHRGNWHLEPYTIRTLILLLYGTGLYDPASGVFIFNAPTNSSRFFLSTTLLNNGQVLVTGQETSAIIVSQPVPSELYQP